ncbi:MAG TPA: CDP-diacylglycerol diphosphatase [Caulobacteraceae bacterium]|nr:CDP-diacylglycerol diphosphatase [Caulobacteraceae bacterium]
MARKGVGRKPQWRTVLRAILAIAVAAPILSYPAQAADPNALWHVVHDLCVPDERTTGRPAPCSRVDIAGGYAVLKDIRGSTQLLVVPTERLSGIEDPQLLRPGPPNYWQDAWDARDLFEKRAGRPVPRQDLGLAVNSIDGRSQNQLHIHIDCVRADVRDALAARAGRFGAAWSRPMFLAGQRYRVMRLSGAELGNRDPFKLLASGDRRARASMGLETLAVIGATLPDGRPGFFLLADRANLVRFDIGAAEQLLDHDCAVLRPR